MLGQIELENFNALTKLPQDAASAWTKVTELTGTIFKPVLYVGRQQVNGINHWFIAEETQITLGGGRRLILVTVNHRDGQYSLVSDSIETIVP